MLNSDVESLISEFYYEYFWGLGFILFYLCLQEGTSALASRMQVEDDRKNNLMDDLDFEQLMNWDWS